MSELATLTFERNSKVCAFLVFGVAMKALRRQDARLSKSAKAVRRAITRSNPLRDPPTVGKPVISDPAEPRRSSPERGKRKDKHDRQ